MIFKSQLMNLTSRVVDLVSHQSQRVLRDAKNVDICLASLCGPEVLAKIQFPSAYVEFMRTCIEHTNCKVNEVKK